MTIESYALSIVDNLRLLLWFVLFCSAVVGMIAATDIGRHRDALAAFKFMASIALVCAMLLVFVPSREQWLQARYDAKQVRAEAAQ